MTQRRVLESRPVVRNVPMRPRDWQELLERDETEAVETDGGEMALSVQDGQLHLLFAFESQELLKAAFNPMWAALRPKLKQYSSFSYARFDLIAFPVREWIDPMLDEADFMPVGEWLELEHRELAEVAPPEPPEGVRIRRAAAADFERIVAIEREAYGELADGETVTRERLASAGWVGALEESRNVIGYAINAEPAGAAGRVLSLAVAPEARGRGLGRVLLQAAAYQLASKGARTAMVRGRPDIPRSVETAVAVGFRPGRSAIEFRRTLDEKAVAARRRKRQVDGMKVRFGDWR